MSDLPGPVTSSQDQIFQLEKENQRLKLEVQQLTELWQRDRETMIALILRRFPKTKEELQSALAASAPFSTVLSEVFPEHPAKA